MHIQFFGTRGSIPTPGPNTQVYGGNTACTFIKGTNTELILDAGTGIRALAHSKQLTGKSFNLLLTHNHWDHIQGFPFFNPIYHSDYEINIYVAPTSPNQPDAVLKQMDGCQFPVSYRDIAATINLIEINERPFEIGEFTISPIAMNHPNGGLSYIIKSGHKQVAYVTDNELHTMDNAPTDYLSWCDKLTNVDLLIHDAQFIESELKHRHNWGHSSIEQAIELAIDAKVNQLALYSHAPERTDNEICLLLKELSSRYCTTNTDLNFCFSKEGQIITLD